MLYQNIQLSDKEIESIECYRKQYGDTWANRSLDHLKAEKYIDTYLKVISSVERRPYNNCVEGTIVWGRQDGNPITQDDLDALNNYWLGQMNLIKGNIGDMQVTQKWACDSGD